MIEKSFFLVVCVTQHITHSLRLVVRWNGRGWWGERGFEWDLGTKETCLQLERRARERDRGASLLVGSLPRKLNCKFELSTHASKAYAERFACLLAACNSSIYNVKCSTQNDASLALDRRLWGRAAVPARLTRAIFVPSPWRGRVTRSRTLEPRKQIAFHTRGGEGGRRQSFTKEGATPRHVGLKHRRSVRPSVRPTDGRTVYPSFDSIHGLVRVSEGEGVRVGSPTLGILLVCVSAAFWKM